MAIVTWIECLEGLAKFSAPAPTYRPAATLNILGVLLAINQLGACHSLLVAIWKSNVLKDG